MCRFNYTHVIQMNRWVTFYNAILIFLNIIFISQTFLGGKEDKLSSAATNTAKLCLFTDKLFDTSTAVLLMFYHVENYKVPHHPIGNFGIQILLNMQFSIGKIYIKKSAK